MEIFLAPGAPILYNTNDKMGGTGDFMVLWEPSQIRGGQTMLLAIDIGNSNIVIGGIQDDRIAFEADVYKRQD